MLRQTLSRVLTRTAMECIGNSDALYHNIEHTMLVTLAGHAILRGRSLHTHLDADDYAHVLIACLAHDIGYVRGLFKEDDEDGFVIDAAGTKVSLPRGASDASLMSYHVDRSKLYVMERIAAHSRGSTAAHRARHRGHAVSEPERRPGIRRGGLDPARRRLHRAARRSQLSAQGQCALLRVRGGRHQPPARL